jgi:hypothetical protein
MKKIVWLRQRFFLAIPRESRFALSRAYRDIPPSTKIACPVMKDDSSETR